MSNASATARAPWTSDLRLPTRRTVLIVGAVIALAALAFGLVRLLPPSVPDLPVEQAQALGRELADAAQEQNGARVRTLLDQGANPDQASTDGTPAIVWAAHFSDHEMLENLLRYGANPDTASRLGLTALHVAADRGDIEATEMLLDEDADPSLRDAKGLTPLLVAARTGEAAVVDALIDAGADVNAADPEHDVTPLMMAGWFGQSDATRRLLDAGAEVDLATRTGPVPEMRLPGFGSGSHGDGIVRGGIPPQGQRPPTPGGMTALLYAARAGDLESVRMLVEAGADIEKPEANGIRPLLMAITNARIDIAEYLLDQGAEVNATDWYGRAPLWAAIEIRNVELPPNAKEHDNGVDRPAALALAERLATMGADVDLRVKEYPPVRGHLMEGGSIAWVDVTGQTAFFRAAFSGDVEAMTMLLDHGADPNIGAYRGTTPLMAAAGVNWVFFQTYDEGEDRLLEAIKLAMKHGQDVNAANSMGITALHGAANRGSNKILRFLVENGADLTAADDQGRTAMDWAKGVFLATLPAQEKPETMALIAELCAERGLTCGSTS